jgi:hypothetical protein
MRFRNTDLMVSTADQTKKVLSLIAYQAEMCAFIRIFKVLTIHDGTGHRRTLGFSAKQQNSK